MCKRAATLVSTALFLLALCSSQSSAGVGGSARPIGVIPPMAVLDPAFGGDGLVTLPGTVLDSDAHGAATKTGDLLVSGGPDLRLLTNSGDSGESFGVAGTLSPPQPEGGEFSLSDFTIDPEGRLLIVGTSRFPADDSEVPRSLVSGIPVFVPSAVRILRYLPDGRPDPTFGQAGVIETDFGLPPPHDKQGSAFQPEASMEATGIAVDSQGRIVVTGSADIRLGPSCVHDIYESVAVSTGFLARLTANGAADPSFSGDGLVGGRRLAETPLRAESVSEPVVGPSGSITYRSTAISACPWDHGRWGVAQLKPDGRTRKGMGRKGAVGGYFRSLVSQPDGSVVALARMSWTGGEAFRARLIRIGPNGEVDRSFGHHGQTIVKLGPAWGNEPDSLAIDARGRILLGGTLVIPNRRSLLLVRLSSDGRQESSFGPNGRVARSFPSLVPFGPSDLFLDPEGRAVTVHRYNTREQAYGLVIARYLLRN